jgi:nickel-type superoxide dismutase maturation protease
MIPVAMTPKHISKIPWAGRWEILSLLLKKRIRFYVQGNSMNPLLFTGEEVLVNPKKKVMIGSIIVARHPYRSTVTVIKYVDQINVKGHFYVLGLNPSESSDSRTFGHITPDLIYGCVSSKLPPLSIS